MTRQAEYGVKIWEQEVQIPTYGVGEKEKNPMFLEKRVYQGSSGRVYPYPVIDKIEDQKTDQTYRMIFLENEYLQIWIMPELGGRIYRALDKTNDYDFVYYNRVIKPALVGLAGPWISGGIEFNWPQHHRPNTYGPVEFWTDDSHTDKKTLWVSETDRMYGTKVTTGFTLHAGRAYIEISARLYNPTGEPQTFLWWANPAVSVHEETQSVFPPDVHAVMDHGKRDVSTFPIATGRYYKMDYSSGVDISRYKNIPVPTSYMAYHSDFDFVGGYDYKAEAGILHVADHHISPGKKQWTWGCGAFGKAWDRNLTDQDGPYIELMTGVFTDNQPDFTWLNPYEEKRFTQYFLPYKKMGRVSAASRDVLLDLRQEAEYAQVKVYATRAQKLRITVAAGDAEYLSESAEVSPEQFFSRRFPVDKDAPSLCATVRDEEGKILLTYTLKPETLEPLPEPATAIPADPAQLGSNEALYLAGLHLEQYRHATYEPDPYYLEGMRRDKGDIRINNAYGTLLLRRGLFAEAEACFRRAIQTATRHSPNPYDGEAFYNLGKSLLWQGREAEAFDAFYKSVWSDAWQSAGYLKLAQISCRRGEYAQALEFARESLLGKYTNYKARNLLTIVLRHLRDDEGARAVAAETLALDPMDFVAVRELGDADRFARLMRGDPHNFITAAESYAELGFYSDAVEILEAGIAQAEPPYAMLFYYKAQNLAHIDKARAKAAWATAARACPDYCFPNTLSDYAALKQAAAINPGDANALYYTGCFLYDKKRHDDAAACWEQAARLGCTVPAVYRNLALYCANKKKDYAAARTNLEKAFAMNPSDARIFYEICELYKKTGESLAFQLENMESHMELVNRRDDLVILYAEILNGLERYAEALDLLLSRKFHPWEGGEGKVPAQHIEARIGLAKQAMRRGAYESAVSHLAAATVYEESFGEGKLPGAQENNIYYYLGEAYMHLDKEKAAACFEKASTGLSEPASAMYYNDQPPHMIYFQGCALRALGREAEARSRFYKLVTYGEQNVFKKQTMDYFAVSLPDFLVFETDLDEKNAIHCHYMMGLGYCGLGETDKARASLCEVLKLAPNHAGAKEMLKEMESR
ncbi:MAG: DUF5107 domain-containing protein [Candidatus Howiella sp.]